MAALMEDRYPDAGRLAYSPVVQHPSPLTGHLFEVVPDWSQYKNGTAGQSDVGAALSVFREFIEILRAFVKVVRERARQRPSSVQAGPEGILSLFDELESAFCLSTADTSDWRGKNRAQTRRTRLAKGLLLQGGTLGDRFLSSHSFSVIALEVCK